MSSPLRVGIAADCGRLSEERAMMADTIRLSLEIKKRDIEDDGFDRPIRNIFTYGHSFRGGEDYSEPGLAYNVVIVGESMGTVRELCQGSARISRCGYLHPVSHAAVSPIEPVMANTYCVER